MAKATVKAKRTLKPGPGNIAAQAAKDAARAVRDAALYESPPTRKRRRRRKRAKFAPVAREVRKAFRAAEAEASRLLTEFLGYPVEVRRKRDAKPKPGKPGDTTTPGKMARAGRKATDAGYYDTLSQRVSDLFAP